MSYGCLHPDLASLEELLSLIKQFNILFDIGCNWQADVKRNSNLCFRKNFLTKIFEKSLKCNIQVEINTDRHIPV
jgi:hypothetical protein